MDNLHDMMNEVVASFVHTIKSKVDTQVEVVSACRALEADVICKSSGLILKSPLKNFELTFVSSPVQLWGVNRGNTCLVSRLTSRHGHEERRKGKMDALGTIAALERLERLIFKLSGWQTSYTASMQEWEQWTDEGLARALSPERSEKRIASPSLIETLLKSGVHPQTALCEARENIGPGTDTTSATLAHILYALAKNPPYQATLRDELKILAFPTDITSLESIPKLRACIYEGIRWTGAAAAMLPRIVPEEGAWLDGKYLPGGTTITSSPIWYLHDQHVFPNPYYYNPYRWLNPDGTALNIGERPLQEKYYIPFSKGPYVCIGAHFSYYELYLSISQLLKHFKLSSSSNGPSIMDNRRPNTATKDCHFTPVRLPKRKEWVAAVPTECLNVRFSNISKRED
ncbi:hypothetical protein N0V93_009376 [Gnomoniopsis smithogilvyi]|uniref:Cytochrome P450 n=1 Tax=Gnomoniopsis smithogilvyi TaxID=1191159 RepID=A0A9W8YJI2_9PEZI|nr:hypothetical protein N0V93_009376 [Gnomoniopsis smithogilvyi]